MSIVLTREQIRRIDELAIGRFGISGLILMENAGRGAAEIIERAFGPAGRAFIACGTGNNGGDGLVIARHLHNAGWTVRVLIAGNKTRLSPDAATNDRIVRAMSVERWVAGNMEAMLERVGGIDLSDVVVDALLGTGFRGEVRSPLRELIEAMNRTPKRAAVAIDVPSGLDCDTGMPGGAAFRADLTITFAALKSGLVQAAGRPFVGRCEVVGIGAPKELIHGVAAGGGRLD